MPRAFRHLRAIAGIKEVDIDIRKEDILKDKTIALNS